MSGFSGPGVRLMRMSPLQDPLGEWPNDDLLLTEAARERLGRWHPKLLRALDWPELRAAFSAQDVRANRGKIWSRRQGLAAVLLTGLGVILLTVSSLFGGRQDGVNTLALGSMFCGGSLGLLHWGLLRSRHDWLGNRFWTERLRELHFQGIVNNLSLCAEAMDEDAKLEELQRRRGIWLDEYYHGGDDPRTLIRAVLKDQTLREVWIFPEWRSTQPPPAESENLAQLLEGLRRLRIGIQWTYANKNLGDDVYSAPTRGLILRFVMSAAAVAVIAISAVGILCAASGRSILGITMFEWTIVSGVISAVGLMAQSINQGLQTQADTDRYEWYGEEVDNLRREFEGEGLAVKVAALRRLEHASYVELRQFLRTHSAARFTS